MITYKEISDNEDVCYTAIIDNKTVGRIEAGHDARIHDLFVDVGYRRRGIGRKLLDSVICRLKLSGCDTVRVDAPDYLASFFGDYGFYERGTAGTEQHVDVAASSSSNCISEHPAASSSLSMEYIPNEIWDVLDRNGNRTGRYHERGRAMDPGDYHLVVHVWKHNGRGKWLIDKRDSVRGTSIDGKWETTGGSAIAGDDSLMTALRETKEELGLDLDPKKGLRIYQGPRYGADGHTWLIDSWVFEHDCSLESITLQNGETCDVMWASSDAIREMMDSGDFLGEWFYPYFSEMVEQFG